MPNHYTTVFICYPPHATESQQDETYWIKETYRDSTWYDFSVDKFREAYSGKNLCELVAPMPASVQDTTVGTDGKSSDDIEGRYGWAKMHWGTKWGAYSFAIHQLGGDGAPVCIEFQSGWEPPHEKCLRQIIQHFEDIGFTSITAIGCDPYDGSTRMALD